MPDPSPDRFSIDMSSATRARLKADAEWARERGLLPDFTAALREIEYRLSVEPEDWGESRERLVHLRVQMRCGTSRMLTVMYGVFEDHRTVYVREFRLNRNYRPRPSGG